MDRGCAGGGLAVRPPASGAHRGLGLLLRGLDPAPQLVAAAAAGLVEVGSADHDAAGAAFLAVRSVRGVPAHHADRERLGDVLGDREELRHGIEGPPGIVLVEARDDHALPLAGEALAHLDQLGTEELPLVDADHLGLVGVAQDLAGGPDRARGDAQLAVRDDRIAGEPVVHRGLEDLDPLAGDLGAAQAADQLLRLAAVHAADDDLDPARVGVGRCGLCHGGRTLSERDCACQRSRVAPPPRGGGRAPPVNGWCVFVPLRVGWGPSWFRTSQKRVAVS